jgi:hypothetical protein
VQYDSAFVRFTTRTIAGIVTLSIAACGGSDDPGGNPDAGANASTITFSPPGRVFAEPLSVEVSTESTGTLRYTLDGSVPSATSAEIAGPLSITRSTDVRVALFGADGTPADSASQPYLLATSEVAAFQSNLPIVVVETWGEDRIDDEDRPRTYYPMSSVFIDTNGNGASTPVAAPDFAGRTGMHIRGSSSTSYDKKQYKLETWDEADADTAVSVLGFPAESDWILHAPYSDKSLVRNHFVYTWYDAMGRYAARTKLVEVFLDRDDGVVDMDDYVGVYLFTEKIKRDPNRIDVTKLADTDNSEPEVTGGYVLVRDWDWSPDNGVRTARYEDELQFVYPKPERVTTEQRVYVQTYLDDLESALDGADFADPNTGYAAYIDTDAFIDHHLMVELGRNVDGFVLSTYLYKDRGGLLAMGPVWDYNGALGNADYFGAWDPQGWHHEIPEFPEDNPNGYRWYDRLFQDPAFRSRYAARWRELRTDVLSTERLMADIDAAAALLTDAAARNFERWPILGEYVWPNADGFEERTTYASEIAYLKDWLTQRLLWMDSQLGAMFRHHDAHQRQLHQAQSRLPVP